MCTSRQSDGRFSISVRVPETCGSRCESRSALPTVTDPVCGQAVAPDSPSSHPHNGTVYCFCGEACRRRFSGNPDGYLIGPRPAAPAAPVADDGEDPELRDLNRRLAVAIVLGVIVAALAMTDVIAPNKPFASTFGEVPLLIAQAVLDGKSVLFLAEKLAALEVVQRRLAAIGLGAACLALHSDGANRRKLLAELDTTLKAPRPAPPDRDTVIRPLGALRGRLNRHAAAMHAPIGETGWTAFRAIGEVARLRRMGVAPPDLRLDAAGWTADAIAAHVSA